MVEFLRAGFILRENVIKRQWNCTSYDSWVNAATRGNFLLIVHENLYVFRKPRAGEDVERYRDSMAW
jgi:hypothetical protein